MNQETEERLLKLTKEIADECAVSREAWEHIGEVLNTAYNLGAERYKEIADQYEQDWRDAKSEFGSAMAKMRQCVRDREAEALAAMAEANELRVSLDSARAALERVTRGQTELGEYLARHPDTVAGEWIMVAALRLIQQTERERDDALRVALEVSDKLEATQQKADEGGGVVGSAT